jgi:glycosyltransferase involved in cell wall biosynthesis
MKVAILKNRVYKGGVSQVLASMIKVLNEKGIVPDILTFRSNINPEIISKDYGQEIKFNIVPIFFDIKMPYEWNFIFFNFISKFYVGKYDLLINSNNSSFLAPKRKRTITYIHFPRKARAVSKLKSLHIPEEGKKTYFDIKVDPFLLADIFYRMNYKFGKNEKLLCNSEYTKKMVLENYSVNPNDIKVLYPPVALSNTTKSYPKKAKSVVTLGRFSPEKRQLEQIEIASQLPDFKFSIIGFKGDEKYFEECEKSIQQKNISNVKLFPNISFEEINTILEESLYFLHNVRNEPFGIGTAQAIAKGCIPMVHATGGSLEIVKQEKLCFHSIEDCISKLKSLELENSNEKQQTFDFQIEKYSMTQFENTFREVINQYPKIA